MGLFLQTAIIPDCKETEAREALKKIAARFDLIPEECRYKEYAGGTAILLNEDCVGYDTLAKAISKALRKAALLLYTYDGDYWGYFLFDNGKEIDMFDSVPDYFEGVSEKEKQEVKGNAKLISDYFHVEESSIKNYLVFWTGEMTDKKAYEDDEFEYLDCWQMADFMKRLGYPYEWE